eukprot:m.369453 g.369453  ORF g.369453 m.369453 type:complete len:769 (+) comp56116_c0_seq9:3-2309(+)
MSLAEVVAAQCGQSSATVDAVLRLIAEGNTVPFIARYRNSQTGGLQANQLRQIIAAADELQQVRSKAERVRKQLAASGQLTSTLEQALLLAEDLEDIEDIYAPFKKTGSRTAAGKARAAGLEPHALLILQGQVVQEDSLARELNLADEEVHEGLVAIVGEHLANAESSRDLVRNAFQSTGCVTCKLKKAGSGGEHSAQRYKFAHFEGFQRGLAQLRNVEIQQLQRGKLLGLLTFALDLPTASRSNLTQALSKAWRARFHASARLLLEEVVERCLKLLLERQKRHAWKSAIERAEQAALELFRQNFEALLLAQPLVGTRVLAIDPGYVHGCKLAMLGVHGEILALETIFPHSPQSRTAEAESTLLGLLQTHSCNVIGIGNGSACRQTERFVSRLRAFLPDLRYTIVNEAGASAYSTSDLGEEELPGLTVLQRGAVSIGRRLQDPLSELIKVDAKSLGVGQYQKDLNESSLAKVCDGILEDCVHFAPVDLNRANRMLLTKVAGLGPARAKAIIAHRTAHGPFLSRQQLLDVPGVGLKSFEQSAGFLRLRCEATACSATLDAFDCTSIHPESYSLARDILRHVHCDHLPVGGEQLRRKAQELLNHEEPQFRQIFPAAKWNFELTRSILQALEEALDSNPRSRFSEPLFFSEVREFSDVHVGTLLRGKVSNVTDFGTFVDCGVGCDVLVRGPRSANVVMLSIVHVSVNTIDREHKKLSGTFADSLTETATAAQVGKPKPIKRAAETHSSALETKSDPVSNSSGPKRARRSSK